MRQTLFGIVVGVPIGFALAWLTLEPRYDHWLQIIGPTVLMQYRPGVVAILPAGTKVMAERELAPGDDVGWLGCIPVHFGGDSNEAAALVETLPDQESWEKLASLSATRPESVGLKSDSQCEVEPARLRPIDGTSPPREVRALMGTWQAKLKLAALLASGHLAFQLMLAGLFAVADTFAISRLSPEVRAEWYDLEVLVKSCMYVSPLLATGVLLGLAVGPRVEATVRQALCAALLAALISGTVVVVGGLDLLFLIDRAASVLPMARGSRTVVMATLALLALGTGATWVGLLLARLGRRE